MLSFSDFEATYTGKRYEYINGAAAPMGPEFVHPDGTRDVFFTAQEGLLLAEVIALINAYAKENLLGTTLMDVGFLLSTKSPELRGADAAFISSNRLGVNPISDSWLSGPPDLVVRIAQAGVDAGSRIPVTTDGTRLLWVIHPDSRVIDVYRPNEPIISLRLGDTLDGYDVLPGFKMDVAELFAGLD
jgi:Uma2 family endonuclease